MALAAAGKPGKRASGVAGQARPWAGRGLTGASKQGRGRRGSRCIGSNGRLGVGRARSRLRDAVLSGLGQGGGALAARFPPRRCRWLNNGDVRVQEERGQSLAWTAARDG